MWFELWICISFRWSLKLPLKWSAFSKFKEIVTAQGWKWRYFNLMLKWTQISWAGEIKKEFSSCSMSKKRRILPLNEPCNAWKEISARQKKKETQNFQLVQTPWHLWNKDIGVSSSLIYDNVILKQWFKSECYINLIPRCYHPTKKSCDTLFEKKIGEVSLGY